MDRRPRYSNIVYLMASMQEGNSHMPFLHAMRKRMLLGGVLLLMLLAASLQIAARSAPTATAHALTLAPVPANPQAEQLRQQIRAGKLASTVHVLDTFAPTTIVQFPLVPSGVKSAFPNAKGLVTIVRGS